MTQLFKFLQKYNKQRLIEFLETQWTSATIWPNSSFYKWGNWSPDKKKDLFGRTEKLTAKQVYANALNFQSRGCVYFFFFLLYHANGIFQKIFSIVKCSTLSCTHECGTHQLCSVLKLNGCTSLLVRMGMGKLSYLQQ